MKVSALGKGQVGPMLWAVALVVLLAVGVAVFLLSQSRAALGPKPDAPIQVVFFGTPYLKTDRPFDHVDLWIDGALRAQWDQLDLGDHVLPADVAGAIQSAYGNRSTKLLIRVKAMKDGVPYDFTMNMMPATGRSRAIASSFSNPTSPARAGDK